MFPTRPVRPRRLLTGVVAVAAFSLAAGGAEGWQRHSPLLEPRTEVAAGLAGGEIVVVGGFVANGANTARADAYSIANDRWRRLPDLPLAVDHAAAASVNGRVYVLGGYGGDRAPLRTAFVLVSGTWRKLASLPDARAAAAAAVAGGRLYVVGGVDGRRSLARIAFALDLRTGRWSRIPGPTPREHLAAAGLGTRVYALAGRKAGIDTNLAVFESYNPRTRRWERLRPIPSPRGGTGAAALPNTIVSVGGEEPPGTIRSVYAYNFGTRRWRRLPDLPTPRHGLGVVARAGRVYVLGGGPEPGLTVTGAVESLAVG
jgi:N-acetylneuraminic acid mutarotase